MGSKLVLCFLLGSMLYMITGADSQTTNLIKLDSELSPISPSSWPSLSGRFAFGFYQKGNGGNSAVGIWLVGDTTNTIVWTAFRDDAAFGPSSTIIFTQSDILLRLPKGQGDKHITDIKSTATAAAMLDTGEFVIYGTTNNSVIWSSFDHPTDTILGGQTVSTGYRLNSSSSATDQATGNYYLVQYYAAFLAYSIHYPEEEYWMSNDYKIGDDFTIKLNQSGFLCQISRSTGLCLSTIAKPNSSVHGTVIYRATIGFDGILRLFSHSFDGNSSRQTSMKQEWASFIQCQVPDYCGLNSYCTIGDYENGCLCLPGFDFVHPNQRSLGCYRNSSGDGCSSDRNKTTTTAPPTYKITPLENLYFGGTYYTIVPMKKEDCPSSCLADCNCWGAIYYNGNCMKQSFPFSNARLYPNESVTGFLKVALPQTDEAGTTDKKQPIVVIDKKKKLVRILVASLGSITFSCFAIAVFSFFIYRRRVTQYRIISEKAASDSAHGEEYSLRLFSYHELEKATNGFEEELGRGSSGAVFKGVLSEGKNKIVAVKRLEKVVEEGEREFRAEMSAIGRTHHRNLVRLLGFCTEGPRRLLVYEYMPNGSLADLLFKAEKHPTWSQRVRIALDVARGVLYLHEECETRIIHCDIKPQNILMDENWTAKISDFGLAKLLMPNQTRTFTGARGTGGYMAPEWQRNYPITVRADVYSFGIVLLEIICCRSNMEVNVLTADEIILSSWVYKCFEAGELRKLVDDEEADMMTLERMVKVGLWCIQDEPSLRPSMKNVILMLEGIMSTSNPPSPIPSSPVT